MAEEIKGRMFVQVGTKETGKTTETIKTIHWMLQKGIQKRVLVLDRGHQKEYDQYHVIPTAYVPHLVRLTNQVKVPIFVVRFQNESEEKRPFFEHIKKHLRNTFLVFEDCTAYLSGNVPDYIKDVLFGNRNAGNHVFFNVHGLNRVPPIFYENGDYLILRRSKESPDALLPKVQPRELIAQAMEQINAENAEKWSHTRYKLASRVIDLVQSEIIEAPFK